MSLRIDLVKSSLPSSEQLFLEAVEEDNSRRCSSGARQAPAALSHLFRYGRPAAKKPRLTAPEESEQSVPNALLGPDTDDDQANSRY